MVNVVQAALKTTKKTAEQLIHDGAVVCRGRALMQTHFKLEAGDELEIEYAPQPAKQAHKASKKSQSQKSKFEVVHDDEDIIVVNKPAGLLTVPSPHREKNTLRSQIDKWLETQGRRTHRRSTNPRNSRPIQAICVHRLDRGVSGLLVFAKNEDAAAAFRLQFSQRKPMRQYAAIVAGKMTDSEGTFRSYLATDEQSLNRYSVDQEEDGELAITHFRVKERWREATLVEVRLETGRRNQIRVHFAEASHPVLGDPRYRPDLSEHSQWPYKRIALHAETLGFTHPQSGEKLMFKAPWPQEFRDLRRKLKR